MEISFKCNYILPDFEQLVRFSNRSCRSLQSQSFYIKKRDWVKPKTEIININIKLNKKLHNHLKQNFKSFITIEFWPPNSRPSRRLVKTKRNIVTLHALHIDYILDLLNHDKQDSNISCLVAKILCLVEMIWPLDAIIRCLLAII
jgi:hypothetical protein